MSGALFASVLLLVVLTGLLMPAVAFAGARIRERVAGRSEASRVGVLGVTLSGALEPAAHTLHALAGRSRRSVRFDGAALALALPPRLAAFALIPYAGRYQIGDYSPEGVVADLEGGVVVLLVLWLVAAGAPLLSSFGRAPEAGLAARRSAAASLSFEVAFAVCLLPFVMLYGSLSLGEIARVQDHTLAPFAALRELGAPGWLAALELPGWGILMQPLAFALLLFCAAARAGHTPFDVSGGRELAGGTAATQSGVDRGIFALAAQVELPLAAALVTTLCLGGYALPFASQEQIVAAIGVFLGQGLANILCGALHTAVFLVKSALLLGGLLMLRGLLPRPRPDQLVAVAWRGVLPLAIANAMATAAVVLWLQGDAPA